MTDAGGLDNETTAGHLNPANSAPSLTVLRVDSPPLIILAGRMIDGTGAPPAHQPAIHIAGGRVVAIERRSDDWRPAAGSQIIDEPDSTVMPGLLDAHVHLAFPANGLPEVDEELRVRAGFHANRLLAGGVTTIRDLGGAGQAAEWVRESVRNGTRPGPRTLVAGRPITTPHGHCHWFGRLADDEKSLVDATKRTIDEGADVIKIILTGGMLTPGSDPYQAQFSLRAVEAAVREAHRAGLRVAGHALSTPGVSVAIRAGVDTLEHGWTIGGGRQDFEPSIAREAAGSGIIASVSALQSLRVLLTSESGKGSLTELRRRLEPHRALAEAGVPMLVHSDAGADETRFDQFSEAIRVFAEGFATSAVEAIRAATEIPARALGLIDRLGTIEVGKVADLIVIDGDPSVDLRALSSVRRVVIGVDRSIEIQPRPKGAVNEERAVQLGLSGRDPARVGDGRMKC